ncbi:MAG: sugar porter family MFS transporter [Verrucomicrobia bacterium]|nr:sugar porter family MFS transporter [Verrucomicrobiota bacterium]
MNPPSATLRTNWKYLLPICLIATFGGLLFGFDTGVISGAIEPLTAKFGLTSAMKGWTSGCVLIGCALGVLVVGPLSDRYGRKLAMFLAALMFFVSSVGTSVPSDIITFIIFRFLGGIGIGIASISTPMYIAEITPGSIRGRLVAVNQIAIVGGLALVYFVNYGIARQGPALAGVPAPSAALRQVTQAHQTPTALDPRTGTFTLPVGAAHDLRPGMNCSLGLLADAKQKKPTPVALATIGAVGDSACEATVIPAALPHVDWAAFKTSGGAYPQAVVTVLPAAEAWTIHTGWRWMFASGILPSILFALMLLGIPESPRWLIEQQRDDRARLILTKVAGADFAAAEAAAIRESLAGEQGTWAELFSPRLAVPLGLGVALAILQQVTGINVFLYFGTTIFNNLSAQTGIDAGMLNQAIIGGSGVLFTIIAIATVDKWGRKPLMFLGTAGMFVSLVAMGVMAQMIKDPASAASLMLAFIILYIACFGLSVGPVVWVLLSEIYPTAIRGRALGLATFCLWIANYIVTQTFPIMDQNVALIAKFNHAFPFYVYAFFCLVLLGVMFFVPETKGKSLEQIETFWSKK